MREATRTGFIPFTDDFEGYCNYLYTDKVGLVTTGRGNLVDSGRRRQKVGDPMGSPSFFAAQALPWMKPSSNTPMGTPASPAEIRIACWNVKNAWPLVQSAACWRLTTMRLTREAVDALTFRELDRMWAQIVAHFPAAESYPAAAQLTLISMSWAMGAGGFDGFPTFSSCVRTGNWAGAALECTMKGAGVEPRNIANRKLLLIAANAADPDALA